MFALKIANITIVATLLVSWLVSYGWGVTVAILGMVLASLAEDTARGYRWYQLDPRLVSLAKNILAAPDYEELSDLKGEAYLIVEEEADRKKSNLIKHKGKLFNP